MAPSASSSGEAPFDGGSAFDPTEGVIDVGGEVQSRGNRGLIVFAMIGGVAVGAIVGYLLQQIASKGELVEKGRAKGTAMVEEVQKVSDTRKTISLAMDDLKKTIAQDPKAGAEKITNLLLENFEKHPKVDELFGWQLAAVHSTGVKKVFDLYEEANGLKLDLGYLAGFLNEYGQALTQAGGPAVFAVINTGGAVKLVEAVKPICDLESQTPCEDKDAKNAQGYLVRHDVGTEPVVAPRGVDEKHALLLAPEGNVYQYAFGLEPNKNAIKVYASLIGKVEARLEAMNKAEKIALISLKNYAESPTVDESTSPQADPGGAS